MTSPVSFGRRLTELATEHPERTAIVLVSKDDGSERTLSWGELERGANRAARLLRERGVGQGSWVVVGLYNSFEHYVASYAAWKLGACVLPLSPRLPGPERDGLLELAAPATVVSSWEDVEGVRPEELAAPGHDDSPLPDRVAQPGKAIGSGGSTGRPKIIVDPLPWARVPTGRPAEVAGVVEAAAAWMGPKQTQLVPGPLYHNSPFVWSHLGLFEDHTIVVMERFDAARAVELVERHRVQFAVFVPTMMLRIHALPDLRKERLASLEGVLHTAAPCPPWLKRAWIDLVGPERLYEGFGATEAVGVVVNRGDEWLERPGTLGRPVGTDLRVLDADGVELPPGEVGEIFMRPRGVGGPTYEYRGSAPARTTEDGFVSVGDLGWLDADGWLYLADRRVDLIVSGGSNVYPAEVEAALTEHAGVADVAVVGLPDEQWGRRVHAIVQPADPAAPPSLEELDRHCRERLAFYKLPKSYELIDRLPREESGKIRRSALAREREHGVPA